MQEEELKRVREEIARTQRQMALLPEEKQRPYATRLEELRRKEADLVEQIQREKLKRLAEEIEGLRRDIGLDLEEIRAHIATLAGRVEERLRPEEVAEIGRLVSDIRMFMTGLMLPWEREIREVRAETELWRERVEKGEAELVNRIEGKYAVYESYHHLPTCQTWVKSTPIPYV
jgi:DNA-binding transcriptional MerR regulator